MQLILILKKVEKYSIATDSVEVVADMFDDRGKFCACGFLDKIYFIGGQLSHHLPTTSTCEIFDTKDYTWNDVASMNEERYAAASTVFEGRVVAS